jgi:hypothetical protein
MAYYLPWGTSLASSASDAYEWYPALDLSTIPFHVGSGVWGPQRAVVAPTAPQGPFTDVTVTTAAELQAQIYTPHRRITVDGLIDGSLVIDSDISDVDVIVLPGSRLGSMFIGNFGTPITVNRVRFRGPTVGSYSGGQIHKLDWTDNTTGADFIIDGVAMSGDGANPAVSRIPLTRVALVNSIVSSGCYALSTTSTDMVVAGCTILTGQNLALQGTGDEEAYGWRMNRECQGYQIMYECDDRSTSTRDESSHARVRCHPNPGLDYVYISDNRFVDRVENWLFICDAAFGTGTGVARGVWYLNNECITDGTGTGTLANTTPKLYGGDTEYAYVQNNTFKSTGFTSDSNIGLTGTVNGSAGKSGNTYTSLISDPSWYSPGDPTTIDYTP